MFDTIIGLPVHVLVIHAVVVLVPLGAAGVVAMALVPRWRQRFGVAVLGLLTIGLLAVPVATKSGRKLEGRLNAGGIVGKQIKHHREMGDLVLYPTLALWVLAVALVVLDRRRRTGRGLTIVAILSVLAAGAATAQVGLAGHLGSTAAWSCTIGSSLCK